jgi:hypothetical protein
MRPKIFRPSMNSQRIITIFFLLCPSKPPQVSFAAGRFPAAINNLALSMRHHALDFFKHSNRSLEWGRTKSQGAAVLE